MNSKAFCQWLAEIEDELRRMIRGVFQFTCRRLPELVARVLFETIGPAVVRLCRVLVVLCIWLAILFGPVVVATNLGLPFGFLGGTTWLVLAIIGSVWGRRYLARKRAAVRSDPTADVVMERAGWESISDCVARS
jgi:hypothetical protein